MQPTVLAGSPASIDPERVSLARRSLMGAVLLGVLADALLREGPWALGLFAWMLCFAGSVVALAWHRGEGMTREQRAWLGTAVSLSACLAWRDTGELEFFDFAAMLLALALLAGTMSQASPVRSLLGTRVRDIVHVMARAAADVMVAVVPLILSDSALGAARQRLAGGRSRAAIRAALVTIPLLLLFGALLTEADPVFGSLFKLPEIDFGIVASHIVIAGLFTWIVGGWLRGAVVDDRPRTRLPDGLPFTVGRLEVTTALGALNILFAAFVAVQIGWLFGGERLVRSTTGLGYAQYARRGFFELVWVSLLVLPVLLGSRAAIAPSDAAAIRRHRVLALPLLGLLGGIMASALGRMSLYVHYYGLTTDRLFATVFMAWLAIVFAWLAVTVLRNGGRANTERTSAHGERDAFAAGATITGFLTLAALNLLNPDALIARVNIGRAHTAVALADSVRADSGAAPRANESVRSPIDYAYLTRLGGEAVPQVVEALLRPPVSTPGTPVREAEMRSRCDAVRSLLLGWNDASRLKQGMTNDRAHDWRLWNYGAARARDVVQKRESELRQVTCLDEGGETPFGNREIQPRKIGTAEARLGTERD